jgi:hypothetical protein
MNAFTFYQKIIVINILTIICLFSPQLQSQTIQINKTFTSDEVILPFEPDLKIYGLSISGSLTLNSDTSLVRVILTETNGDEEMLFEAYPMVVDQWSFEFKDACDETCYMNDCYPISLTIQLIDAEFSISYLSYSQNWQGNLSLLQYQAKMNKELMKVESINQYILAKGWSWTADTTSLVKLFYQDKVRRFHNKFNLLGLDYYSGGYFYSVIHDNIPRYTESTVIPSFDWRQQHHADIPGTPYYGGDDQDSTNGWMTGVRNQGPECGDCSAFASIASLEAAINLYANYQFDVNEETRFSEKDAFNCSKFYCDGSNNHVGCDCTAKGINIILNKLKDDGVVNESCFPYMSPYCLGCAVTCDEFTSKCTDPSMIAQIWAYKTYNLIQGDSNQRAAFLKEKIITNGPLTVTLKNWTDDSKDHAVSLIGFETINNRLYWIFKNSWNTTYGEKGYGKEAFWLGSDAPDGIPWIGSLIYSLNYDDTCTNKPISVNCYHDCVTPNFIYYVHEYDRDKDGYYNWGIGKQPHQYACSQEEDSNDDDNRIGPYQEDYSGRPVYPTLNVQQGVNSVGNTIIDGGFLYLQGDTLNDSIYIFQIKNSGSAQLNLDPFGLTHGKVIITYQYPQDQFEITKYPDRSVCMDNDTSTFNIKMNNGAEPGSLAHVCIYLDEPDMDSLFEFTLVFNGCETSLGFDSLETVVEWTDSCRSQYKDLYIKKYGELTVHGTVMLAPEADIFIEPGGKMIIDGGKLTKSCNDQLWNGIQIWGDSTLSQAPPTNQGCLELINNGCIEFAKTAVYVGKKDSTIIYYPYAGGIIRAQDASFLNNQIDAEFLPFVNDNPYTGYELDNFSGFWNCTFKTDQLLIAMLKKPDAHVILTDVKGVEFYSCIFKMEEAPGFSVNDTNKGIGILAYDAKVWVASNCINTVFPCNNYDSTRFENLRYGIKAVNTGQNNAFMVSTTVLDSNVAGIYLSGYHLPEIICSSFYSNMGKDEIPGSTDPFFGCLYLDGTTGYHIENNHFAGPMATLPEEGSITNIGIYVNDSGEDDNEIYNNIFTGLEAGIIAEGINKGEGTGLCLKCNDFRTCLNDMLVIPDRLERGGRYFGIKASQGADDTLSYRLAGNTFTPEVQGMEAIDNGGNEKYFWNYLNEAEHFNYYHHGYIQNYVTYPLDTTNYTYNTITLENKQKTYNKTQACPSELLGQIYKNSEDSRLEILTANQQLLNLQRAYDSLLDGGNTEDLDFDIITSMPDEALELHDQLLTDSPYLSDTIIKQAIYKETVLPNAMIRDVLTVNPQSAKSVEILDALDGRYDPMPEYMMAEIMQGLDQVGALESLESRIGYWKQYRSKAINRLIREYLTDSTITYPNDSLIQLLQDESDLQSKYRLAFAYWDNNQPEEALDILDNIPATFDLTPIEQNINQQYRDYFDILRIMEDSSLNAFQLDSSSVQSLIGIMNDDYPLISTYARGLLMKGKHIDYTETVGFPLTAKKYPAYYYLRPQPAYFTENEHLYLFPNPCIDFTIAYYNTLEQGQSGSLVVYDLHGQELEQIRLNSVQNQRVVNLSSYTDGIYFIGITINNDLITLRKLIKARK